MQPGSLGARLFVSLQHILPQHTLSRLVLAATRVRARPVSRALIGAFMRGFRPEMSDALEADPFRYGSFNDFFTRALRPGARPVAADPQLVVSPVDGTISQIGRIDGHEIIQAKGRGYSLTALLGETAHLSTAEAGLPGRAEAGAAEWTRRLAGGSFATLYLAPYNYHRIHMPLAGTLRQAWFVPGRLFSVNGVTAAAVEGLFARNERVICAFEGACGPFAMALVGALFVGSIATVWHGDVAPRRPRRATPLSPALPVPLELAKGAEMGRFNMGSTVILLFPPGAAHWLPELGPGTRITMGMPLARLT